MTRNRIGGTGCYRGGKPCRFSDLYLVQHDHSTCATCRVRRGVPMVCAICQRPFTPDGVVVLCYTSRETIDHLGTVHASCSAFIDHKASDDTFIRY